MRQTSFSFSARCFDVDKAEQMYRSVSSLVYSTLVAWCNPINIIYNPPPFSKEKREVKNNQRIHHRVKKAISRMNLFSHWFFIYFGSRCHGTAWVAPFSCTAIVFDDERRVFVLTLHVISLMVLYILMYFQSMAFREKMKVDTILEDYKQPEVLYSVTSISHILKIKA